MSDSFRVTVLQASVYHEHDGSLGVLEFTGLPFQPQRFFWLSSIDPVATRASHAHKTCHQLLMCLSGGLTATITSPADDVKVFRMKMGDMVHLEPLMWLDLTEFSTDGVLGVMASQPYDPSEYINDRNEFRELKKN